MVSKQQRQRQLARQKFERQQARRSESRARARRRNTVIASVVGVVVVGAGAVWGGITLTGGNDTGSSADTVAAVDTPPPADQPQPAAQPSTPPPTTAATPAAAATATSAATASGTSPSGCTSPQPGAPAALSFDSEPAMTVDTSATYTMTMHTTCGTVVVTMDAAKTPHTVNSFAFLAGRKFFDHTTCHRLTKGTLNVLQCGDPKGEGTGGPGYTIPDENLTGATYPAGTVAMANTGQPNSGGSQFFLVYQDSQLPPQYTPFGRITSGLDVLRKIAGAGTQDGSDDGAPRDKVVINSLTVDRKS